MCFSFHFPSRKWIQVLETLQRSGYKVEVILLAAAAGIPALANVTVLMEVAIIQRDCITD